MVSLAVRAPPLPNYIRHTWRKNGVGTCRNAKIPDSQKIHVWLTSTPTHTKVEAASRSYVTHELQACADEVAGHPGPGQQSCYDLLKPPHIPWANRPTCTTARTAAAPKSPGAPHGKKRGAA